MEDNEASRAGRRSTVSAPKKNVWLYTSEPLYIQAKLCEKRGEYVKAIECLTELAESGPHSYKVLSKVWIGNLEDIAQHQLYIDATYFENNGSYAEAIQCLSDLSELNQLGFERILSPKIETLKDMLKRQGLPVHNKMTEHNNKTSYGRSQNSCNKASFFNNLFRCVEIITQCIVEAKHSIIRHKVMSRVIEEKIYETIYEELSQGEISIGLYAKAVAASTGDDRLAVSLYVKLRYQSLVDEMYLS